MTVLHRVDTFKAPRARVSYAYQLFEPRTRERTNGKEVVQYGCTLIFQKGEEGPLLKVLQECVLAAWPGNGVERWKNGLIRNPLLEGDGKEARNKKTGEIHSGLGATVRFIRVGGTRKPMILKPNRLPTLDPKDLPSGSWGYPGLNAYAWRDEENAGGDGVSFGIEVFLIDKVATGDEVLGGSGGVDVEALYGPALSDPAGKLDSAASVFD